MRSNLFKNQRIGLQFWRFFILALLSPVKRGYTVDRSQFLNGLITFGIYSLLTGINTYSQTRITAKLFDVEDVEGFSFFGTLVLPFIFTAISLLVIAGILMVVALLMRSDAHYTDVVARFGTLLVIPTLISFIIFLFTIMNASTTLFFFFISLLSMISLFAAIAFTVYSFYNESKTGLDPFYAILLTFVGIGFLAFIFKNSIFTGVFSVGL